MNKPSYNPKPFGQVYRAWDNLEKKWLFDSKEGFSLFGEMVIMGEWGNAAWHLGKEQGRLEVFEMIGIRDVDGDLMFDGDIVEFTDMRTTDGHSPRILSENDGYVKLRGVIEYNEYHGWHINKHNNHNRQIMLPKNNERVERELSPSIWSMADMHYAMPKVIGHIRENPELIEGVV